MIDTLYEWIWWDRFWLPVNLTWADLEDRDGRVYAKASDLYVTLPCAIAFLLVRYLFERLIATPLAASVGIREKARLRVADNPILELYYLSHSRNPGQAGLDGLSKKSGWCVRQVERWFRKRRNQDRPGVLKKFREASWRFVFYLLALIGGVVSLYDKEWFYDTREVWNGFPKQTMLDSQYWYYILEMSFYGSLLFRVTFDVKRKDFKEQIIHHLATLTLLSFSWCVNYIRIGTLVMLIHDASDVLLELQSCLIAATPVRTLEWRRSRAVHPPKHNPTKPHCFLTQCPLHPEASRTNVSEETPCTWPPCQRALRPARHRSR